MDRSQEIRLDGPNGPIGVTRRGEGRPVVLLAGLGSTRRLWGDLPRLMARDLQVVTLDNRGVGDSRGGSPFTLERATADVLAVLDALDLPSAALLGASMGGGIAMSVAVAAPERVRRMVLVSCAPHMSTHGRRGIELLRDLLRHLPPPRVGEALMTLAFATPFQHRHPAFVREAARLYGPEPEDVPGALGQADSLLEGWDLRDGLRGLDIPTLVALGERDPLVPPEDTAGLHDLLARCELLRLPEAAHSVLAEGGVEVIRQVTRFLAG